ncbi:glycoside hydrolase (plasmid) [Rhizobium sp. CB3090]|nr:glycoside hydrolase [Rhizobium sp. CB3090]WFU13077.1 glycoside hydrolase [Rhizobium sp. CB3090]
MMIHVCSMGMVLCGGYLLAASAGGLGGTENGLSASTLSMADISNFDTFIVRSPPPSLGLDPFYAKYADAAGIPIISSEKVPDTALLIARDIVLYMLSERRDVRDALIRAGARVGIMAIDETTTDIPEQRDWQKPALDDPRLTPDERRNYASTIAKMTAQEYWAQRARGMGGLYTTGAVENLMGVPGTRYYGGNILVHEFSHNIFNALRTVDPDLVARVEKAYFHAREKGLWARSYMENTVDEYWAEGTRFWFNTNMAYSHGELTVATSDDFEVHDPELYNIMAEVYRHDHHILADVFYRHSAK